jgi:hypothetical protein
VFGLGDVPLIEFGTPLEGYFIMIFAELGNEISA